jgi:hypothetical protein
MSGQARRNQGLLHVAQQDRSHDGETPGEPPSTRVLDDVLLRPDRDHDPAEREDQKAQDPGQPRAQAPPRTVRADEPKRQRDERGFGKERHAEPRRRAGPSPCAPRIPVGPSAEDTEECCE